MAVFEITGRMLVGDSVRACQLHRSQMIAEHARNGDWAIVDLPLPLFRVGKDLCDFTASCEEKASGFVYFRTLERIL